MLQVLQLERRPAQHGPEEGQATARQGGVPGGFSTPLLTETTQEIPHFARDRQAGGSGQINVDINLTIETPDKYYGDGVFGKSDWLDGEMSLVDYGARAVPNLYLEAPLQTYNKKKGTGAWNAAHFNNATYDKLSKEFVAAVDLSEQRKLAGQIEKLLLDETPIIFPYFYDYLCRDGKERQGCLPDGAGAVVPLERHEELNPPPLGRLCTDAGPAVKPGPIRAPSRYLQCTGRIRYNSPFWKA